MAYVAAANPTVTTAREYVWRPGDRGIYEILCQFASAGTALWLVQDEGGDVVAAADDLGANGTARRVGLWSYGPYGEVVKDATLVGAYAPVHAGHKGLFVDRLDVGVATGGGTENSRLAVGGTLLAYARNRAYAPELGRWMQADPNASGLGTLASASMGGGLSASVDGMDLGGLFGDGASLYQYGRSSPWMGGDPLGRAWDPFDYVDDYLAEDAGSKAAFLERTIGAAHTAAYLTTYIGSWVPGPIGLIAGFANASMGVPGSLQGSALLSMMNTANNVALVANLGHLTASLFTTGAQYAARYGSRAVAALEESGVARKVLSWAGDHHIIPLYMKGEDIASNLAKDLSHAEHVKIHSLIDEIGWGEYKIPKRSMGAQKVEKWLLDNRDMGPTFMRATLI